MRTFWTTAFVIAAITLSIFGMWYWTDECMRLRPWWYCLMELSR